MVYIFIVYRDIDLETEALFRTRDFLSNIPSAARNFPAELGLSKVLNFSHLWNEHNY